MKNLKQSVLKKQHYTFAEIMMVVAIFIIILALIVTAWMSSSNKVRLDNSARLVAAQLNKARALAIRDRKDVEVVFKGRPDYTLLIKEEGASDSDAAKDDFISLPGGTVFSSQKPNIDGETIKDEDTWFTGSANKLVFTKDGSCRAADSKIEIFYVAIGNQTQGSVAGKQPYYAVNINTFSGRITLNYYEEKPEDDR